MSQLTPQYNALSEAVPFFALSASVQAVPRQLTSNLYLRGTLYYFRYKFPRWLGEQTGHEEIRLSLKTGHLRQAKHLASRLYSALQSIIMSTIDYKEIKRRLNRLLQNSLEQESIKLHRTAEMKEPFIGEEPGDLDEFISKWQLNMLRDPKMTGYLSESTVERLVSEKVLTETEAEQLTDDEKILVSRSYMEMYVTLHKLMSCRERGDFLEVDRVLGTDYGLLPGEAALESNPDAGTVAVTSSSSGSTGYLYSEILEKYIETKLTDGDWQAHSAPDHRQRLETFLEIAENKPIAEYSREDFRNFKDVLKRLPPNRKHSIKYKGKSIEELLEMQIEETISPKTLNVTLEAISSLCKWCVREGFLERNLAENLGVKDARNPVHLKKAYTADDLRLIFQHPKFSQGKFKHPSYFWAPLISLFTGMRREEIAQLYCSDVYKTEEEKIWVFDVNVFHEGDGDKDKKIKSENGCRKIPVHFQLVELGLLDYLSSVKSFGERRLFPELTATAKKGKLGAQIGKQFCGVVDTSITNSEKKDFHSLRHTFADFYKQHGLQNDFFVYLFGHRQEKLSARQYGSEYSPKVLYDEVISKLDYGLDLSELKGKFWGATCYDL